MIIKSNGVSVRGSNIEKEKKKSRQKKKQSAEQQSREIEYPITALWITIVYRLNAKSDKKLETEKYGQKSISEN